MPSPNVRIYNAKSVHETTGGIGIQIDEDREFYIDFRRMRLELLDVNGDILESSCFQMKDLARLAKHGIAKPKKKPSR